MCITHVFALHVYLPDTMFSHRAVGSVVGVERQPRPAGQPGVGGDMVI